MGPVPQPACPGASPAGINTTKVNATVNAAPPNSLLGCVRRVWREQGEKRCPPRVPSITPGHGSFRTDVLQTPPPCLISNGSNANLTLGFFFFYHPFDGAACSQMRSADFKSSTTLEGQLEVFRLLRDNICSVNPRRQSHRPPLPPPPLLNLRFSLRTQRQSCKSNTEFARCPPSVSVTRPNASSSSAVKAASVSICLDPSARISDTFDPL